MSKHQIGEKPSRKRKFKMHKKKHHSGLLRCWICGKSLPDTGEHQWKKTDFSSKASFPSRVFSKNTAGIPHRIHGANSPHLKFSKSICSDCNNNRTSSHDKSWETLSYHISQEIERNHEGNIIIDPKAVFQNNIESHLLNVHLFFIKHFGCSIVAGHIPGLDIRPFSEAIMEEKAYERIHIKFNVLKNGKSRVLSSQHFWNENTNEIKYVKRNYCVNELVVKIIYLNYEIEPIYAEITPPNYDSSGTKTVIKFELDDLKHAWQPGNFNQKINIEEMLWLE